MTVVGGLELDLEREYPDYLSVPAPGAGVGIAQELDARWLWLIVAARFTLTTSAAVANRFASVDLCDMDGTPWLRAFAPAVQAAGVANQEYDFVLDGLAANPGGGLPMTGRLIGARVPGGWQVKVAIAGMDVADQLGVTRLYVVKRERG